MAGKIALVPLVCGMVALAVAAWPAVLDRFMDRIIELSEAMAPLFYARPSYRRVREAAEGRGWLAGLAAAFLLLGIFASTT